MYSQNIKKLEAKEAEWRNTTLRKALEKTPEWQSEFTTYSGIPVKRVYTPLDLKDFKYLKKLGFPGSYPYTRGIQPTMYRGRIWTMREFAGFGTAEDTNKRYKYLLEHGETGLSVAFDFPTLYGIDSDNPLATGEIGKCGVAVSSLKDMEILFEGIPLQDVTTSMTINGPAAVIWAMYIVTALKQGADISKISGTIQNDILKEYIAQKTFIFPPEPSVRLIIDTFEYGFKQVPRWNTISISGYHIREAGSTAVQELAFTLADGMTYVEKALERGLNIDEFAPRLSFFFNAHNDFFEEIAKFRAARRIWADFMKSMGAKKERSLWLRFHTQTAGCSLTAQQPMNNVIRTTIQALAAVLGGTQSLHTNSLDEALALPTEQAVKIALRTQQIIAYESNVTNTIDPVGGSYYIEWLTDRLEEEAYKYFDRIEQLGGVLPAIEKGFFQKEIASSAYRYQTDLEKKRCIIVGVNKFADEETTPIKILTVPEEVTKRQIERLKKVRAQRDRKKHEDNLDRLRKAAEGTANLMPYIVDCVKSYSTLGEICDTLKSVFGEYRESAFF